MAAALNYSEGNEDERKDDGGETASAGGGCDQSEQQNLDSDDGEEEEAGSGYNRVLGWGRATVEEKVVNREEGGKEPYKRDKKISRMECEICRQKLIRCVHDVTAAYAAARSYTTNVQGLAQGPTSLLLASAEAASFAAVAGAEEKEGEDTRLRRGWGQGGGMVEEKVAMQEKGWQRQSVRVGGHYEYISPDGRTF
jgi:hypothetical protein